MPRIFVRPRPTGHERRAGIPLPLQGTGTAPITFSARDTLSFVDTETLTLGATTLSASDRGVLKDISTSSGALLTTEILPFTAIPQSMGVVGLQDTVPNHDAVVYFGVPKTTGTTITGTGSGFASLTVDTSRTISWQQPSTNSDSQTTITSANSVGDGWAVGINDAYGGMPFSSLIERLAGADVNTAIQNGVAGGSGLTQLPTAPANQVSMHTGTYPDGHLHAAVQESTLGYGASEQVQSFTLTELGPTGTSLRRRYHASGTKNSITYDIYATVYPGEPGMVFWKTVITGPATSLALTATPEGAITLANPAGLLPTGGTLPQAGLWNIDSTHAVYGSLSSLGTTSTIPISPSETSTDPDLVALVPTAPAGNVSTLSSQRLAIVAGRFTKMADVGLSTPQLAAYQNTDRIKVLGGGVYSSGGGTMPASTVLTFYSAEFLTSGVTAGSFANAFALVADYMQPGSPIVSTGTLTTFSYPNHSSFPFNLDEGCYQLAASANAATITLDLGSTVEPNIRYKARLKITGFSGLTHGNGSDIAITLGASPLTAGTDYAITVDVTNQIAYVQLMFDLVASGAGTGQRNNAAIALTAPLQFTAVDMSLYASSTVFTGFTSNTDLLDTTTSTQPASTGQSTASLLFTTVRASIAAPSSQERVTPFTSPLLALAVSYSDLVFPHDRSRAIGYAALQDSDSLHSFIPALGAASVQDLIGPLHESEVFSVPRIFTESDSLLPRTSWYLVGTGGSSASLPLLTTLTTDTEVARNNQIRALDTAILVISGLAFVISDSLHTTSGGQSVAQSFAAANNLLGDHSSGMIGTILSHILPLFDHTDSQASGSMDDVSRLTLAVTSLIQGYPRDPLLVRTLPQFNLLGGTLFTTQDLLQPRTAVGQTSNGQLAHILSLSGQPSISQQYPLFAILLFHDLPTSHLFTGNLFSASDILVLLSAQPQSQTFSRYQDSSTPQDIPLTLDTLLGLRDSLSLDGVPLYFILGSGDLPMAMLMVLPGPTSVLVII